jgi:hypothetical protein
MPQGREAIYNLLEGRSSWPPVVVPFGLDPFGWHGERESYRDICRFALANCTLLPKVVPFSSPLFIGEGEARIESEREVEPDGTVVRRHLLTARGKTLRTEEVQTPGDSSWKTRRRWIENDDDLNFFLSLDMLSPAVPDLEAVREKEQQAGIHGLPYVEVSDPFYTVCEMFPTDTFYIKTLADSGRIEHLLEMTSARILEGIENLCRNAGCPFILRLIGAEMAAPPFMSRASFLKYEGDFYQKAIQTAQGWNVPAAFHCHGPVRDIMDDIWDMGYSFIEPFEPPPRGNVTIAEALALTRRRGVVFGGVDEVLFLAGTPEDMRHAVKECLDGARGTGAPYILSQSATPFYEPLTPAARENILLFMKLGVEG